MKNFRDTFFIPGRTEYPLDLRLLPPKRGGKLFHAMRLHRIGGHSRPCWRTLDRKGGMWIGQCDYCDVFTALWRTADANNDDFKKQEARQIKPYDRYYYNTIARSEQHKGPLIFTMGKALHTLVVSHILSLGDVTNYQSGRDLRIVQDRKGNSGMMFPDYNGSHFLEPSRAGTVDEWESWADSLHDLNKVLPAEDIATVRQVCAQYGMETLPKPEKKKKLRSLDDEWDV